MESNVFFNLLCIAVFAMVSAQFPDKYADGVPPYDGGSHPYADGGDQYVDGRGPYPVEPYSENVDPYAVDPYTESRDRSVYEDQPYDRYPGDYVPRDYIRKYGNPYKDPYERDIRKYKAGWQYGLKPEDIEFIIREKAIPANMHIVGKPYFARGH